MPFEVDNLLLLIAAALSQAFTPEQEQQAQTIRPFLKAIETGDWKALTLLCTEDIIYYPPRQNPLASTRKVLGLKAYLDYVEAVRRNLRGFVFEDVRIYATPKGLAIRYLGTWLGAEDDICRLPGVTLFRFEEEYIRQVKAHWADPQRYRALLRRAQAG
jgi:ketosteroid isomerase-like protein